MKIEYRQAVMEDAHFGNANRQKRKRKVLHRKMRFSHRIN